MLNSPVQAGGDDSSVLCCDWPDGTEQCDLIGCLIPLFTSFLRYFQSKRHGKRCQIGRFSAHEEDSELSLVILATFVQQWPG